MACKRTLRFERAAARPRGRRVRLVVRPRPARPVSVDIFQVSRGRRVLRFIRVAAFTTRRSMTWSGRSNLHRKITDGVFVVRMRNRAVGGRRDVRRFTLRRAQGRYHRAPAYKTRRSCSTLSAMELASPVFGGVQRRPARLGLRLRRAAAVAVQLRRGKRVVRRIAYKSIPAEITQRRVISSRGLKPGLYRVVVTVRRPGELLTRTLRVRRL